MILTSTRAVAAVAEDHAVRHDVLRIRALQVVCTQQNCNEQWWMVAIMHHSYSNYTARPCMAVARPSATAVCSYYCVMAASGGALVPDQTSLQLQLLRNILAVSGGCHGCIRRCAGARTAVLPDRLHRHALDDVGVHL
jgi:hypothetical protein